MNNTQTQPESFNGNVKGKEALSFNKKDPKNEERSFGSNEGRKQTDPSEPDVLHNEGTKKSVLTTIPNELSDKKNTQSSSTQSSSEDTEEDGLKMDYLVELKKYAGQLDKTVRTYAKKRPLAIAAGALGVGLAGAFLAKKVISRKKM